MLHSKFLACLDRNSLRFWFVALLPEDKCWIELQLLRDNRLKSENRLLIRRFVGLHCHCFDLSAGDLATPASGNFVLLGLCSSASAGSVNRLEMDGCLAGVLIFEMAYRLFVVGRWMQLERGLLPFQFGVCAKTDDDRQ